MNMAWRTTSNWRIMKNTTARKIVAYFAATAWRIMTYDTGIRISAWRTFSFRGKTKR